MDLRMPGMGGLEAARRIRALEAELDRPRTTLIALTASAMNLNLEELREAGFDDWVLKPFQESNLFQKLELHRGLRFEVAKREPAPTGSLDPSRLGSLEPAWVREFRQALTRGDKKRMLALLEQVRDPILADGIRSYVAKNRFEALRDLLDSGGQHA